MESSFDGTADGSTGTAIGVPTGRQSSITIEPGSSQPEIFLGNSVSDIAILNGGHASGRYNGAHQATAMVQPPLRMPFQFCTNFCCPNPGTENCWSSDAPLLWRPRTGTTEPPSRR